jgi:ribosomal-protein-alanine N-acetyltransferase
LRAGKWEMTPSTPLPTVLTELTALVCHTGLVKAAAADERVRLRAFVEADLGFLDRLGTDPDALGEFEWPGFVDPRSRRRRWQEDGYLGIESSAVAVVDTHDAVVGIATWRPRGQPLGVTYEIGIAIMPEHRGHGVGTAAQGLLVHYLFEHTVANRLEALTNDGNIGEQKALERLGFRREGLMRNRSFIRGDYVGVLIYGLLRTDHDSH